MSGGLCMSMAPRPLNHISGMADENPMPAGGLLNSGRCLKKGGAFKNKMKKLSLTINVPGAITNGAGHEGGNGGSGNGNGTCTNGGSGSAGTIGGLAMKPSLRLAQGAPLSATFPSIDLNGRDHMSTTCGSLSARDPEMAFDGDRSPYKHGPICILPNLYLGSEHNASNIETLRSLDVRYILNVAKEVTNPLVERSVNVESQQQQVTPQPQPQQQQQQQQHKSLSLPAATQTTQPQPAPPSSPISPQLPPHLRHNLFAARALANAPAIKGNPALSVPALWRAPIMSSPLARNSITAPLDSPLSSAHSVASPALSSAALPSAGTLPTPVPQSSHMDDITFPDHTQTLTNDESEHTTDVSLTSQSEERTDEDSCSTSVPSTPSSVTSEQSVGSLTSASAEGSSSDSSTDSTFSFSTRISTLSSSSSSSASSSPSSSSASASASSSSSSSSSSSPSSPSLSSSSKPVSPPKLKSKALSRLGPGLSIQIPVKNT
ncbi:hypothetical protein HK102_004427, partial [Quaeritorhiza haematococci]